MASLPCEQVFSRLQQLHLDAALVQLQSAALDATSFGKTGLHVGLEFGARPRYLDRLSENSSCWTEGRNLRGPSHDGRDQEGPAEPAFTRRHLGADV
jgi:hypothetical protein